MGWRTETRRRVDHTPPGINDTHSHAVGDAVLKEVARRLSQHARDEDTVCRNGGDEFLYLVMNPRGSENSERIARTLSTAIAQPIDLGDLQPVINASIGIAVYPGDGGSGEELIRRADTAMYRAKKAGIDWLFFDASDMEGAATRVAPIDPADDRHRQDQLQCASPAR